MPALTVMSVCTPLCVTFSPCFWLPSLLSLCPDSRESISDGPVTTAQCTNQNLLAAGVRNWLRKRELPGMCGFNSLNPRSWGSREQKQTCTSHLCPSFCGPFSYVLSQADVVCSNAAGSPRGACCSLSVSAVGPHCSWIP